MAKAKVVGVKIEGVAKAEYEYDVEVTGSDPVHTSSVAFYCQNKENAEKLAEKFNQFLEENKDLYEVYG